MDHSQGDAYKAETRKCPYYRVHSLGVHRRSERVNGAWTWGADWEGYGSLGLRGSGHQWYRLTEPGSEGSRVTGPSTRRKRSR